MKLFFQIAGFILVLFFFFGIGYNVGLDKPQKIKVLHSCEEYELFMGCSATCRSALHTQKYYLDCLDICLKYSYKILELQP